MEPVRNWSDLPEEMLEEMAKRIAVVEDFMAFGGVCTRWRAAASKDKFVRTTSYRVPLLMLAEKPDTDDREFYSLSKRKVSMRLPLPEARGRRCMEAGLGWLFTMSSSGELNLLHPLTRSQIQLLNCKSFPNFDYEREYMIPCFHYITRVVLSANPSHTSDFVVTVMYDYDTFLGCWRPSNPIWTYIESSVCQPHRPFNNLTYYKGKLYAIPTTGQVCVWDEPSSKPAVLFTIDPQVFDFTEAYLVESSRGELLVVTRDGAQRNDGGEDDWSYGVTYFEVIRLDLAKRTWEEEVPSLEGDAIFVGHSAAISIPSSDFPDVIKPNCIYFTDDCIEVYTSYYEKFGICCGGKDMGIYNVEDESITRFNDVESLSFISPPIWMSF